MAEQFLNIKFVSEVEKYPCLYNYNLKEYAKKEITEKAWAAVGKAVNLTAWHSRLLSLHEFEGLRSRSFKSWNDDTPMIHNILDGSPCRLSGIQFYVSVERLQAKEKWKNLRSVFVRNLKPPASGSSKRKKYYLTDSMQFALPFIKSAGIPSGSLHNSINQDNELQASPPPPTSPTASSSEQTERTPSPIAVSTWRSSSQRLKNKTSENDELFSEYLKMKKQNINDESLHNKANKMFLLSLLPDLNCMTSSQIRSFKRQVIDVIENILNVPPTSSTQTLVHIQNSSSILSSPTSPFIVPEIQHPSKSYSQVTISGIKLPKTEIECTTDDGLLT